MGKINWQSVIVAFGYLLLVWLIVQFCGSRTDTFEEFSKYWGLFGMIVGVATGAIPSFFFRDQAQKAGAAAEKAEVAAGKAAQRAELFAGLAPAEKLDEVRKAYPSAFD